MQQQMVSPVKWSQIIKAMWQDGVRSWLEVGSKDVLTKMMRYNLAETDGNWQATSLGSLDSLERASMLTA
jgi:[acyl-carrier-protein] S-malonyltransferase